MNSKTTHSPNRRIAAERPEFPSVPEKHRAQEPDAPRKWQNLTLDDLQSWMDERPAPEPHPERNQTT